MSARIIPLSWYTFKRASYIIGLEWVARKLNCVIWKAKVVVTCQKDKIARQSDYPLSPLFFSNSPDNNDSVRGEWHSLDQRRSVQVTPPLKYLSVNLVRNVKFVEFLNSKEGGVKCVRTSSISSPTWSCPFLAAIPLGLRPQIKTAILFLSLCPAREIPKPPRSLSNLTRSTGFFRLWYFFCTFSAREE